jgi:hypothetical protein
MTSALIPLSQSGADHAVLAALLDEVKVRDTAGNPVHALAHLNKHLKFLLRLVVAFWLRRLSARCSCSPRPAGR